MVGSLERFYGEHGAVFHNHRLANVESRDFLGYLPPEIDIFFLAARQLRAGNQAGRRETILEKGGRRQKIDVRLSQFAGNRAKDRFGVALFQFGQQKERLPIGAQIEKVFWRDLSGHDRLIHSLLAKNFEQLAQLSDPQPLDNIDMLADHRIGLAGERGGNDLFHAGFMRGIGYFSRINTVARDDPENFRNAHRRCVAERFDLRESAEISAREARSSRDGGGA